MNKRPRLGAVIFAILGIMLIAIGGCAPDSGFNNVADYDVVVTHYDPEVDYQKYTTFAVADTIMEYGKPEDDDSQVTEALKNLIISEITTQMINYGYTLENDPENNDPDLVLVAGITITKWTGYVPGYPYYPGYGYGPWYPYYPYYPGWGGGYSYSYDTGTIMIDMFDFATWDHDTGDIHDVWTSGINGILSSSSSYNSDRVQASIKQAFEQSPYLEQK
jgi:hypothetical protein